MLVTSCVLQVEDTWYGGKISLLKSDLGSFLEIGKIAKCFVPILGGSEN